MDLMKEVKEGSCPQCKSKLHVAHYQRKPRRFIEKEYSTRFSLCCSNCRARTFVPSTLFFGSFVYGGIFIIIISSFLNSKGYRYESIQKLFGVSRRTLIRWKAWWDKTFTCSTFWKNYKARFNRANLTLPKDFITIFEDLESLFRFLAHFK